MIPNRHVRPLAALAIASAVAGCGGLQRSAEKAVRDNLKDPESARFDGFYYNSETKRACVTVNAKNSMGGYTGDQQVSLLRGDKGWDWISSTEETQEGCRTTWADNTKIPD